MTALIRSGAYVVEAYANHSRWVASCGRCPRAVRLRPRHPLLNAPMEHLPSWFECDLCGAVTEVLWPTEKTVLAIERLLMMRPDPTTRNWLPEESLSELMFENAAHGIFDHSKSIDAKPGESLFMVDDGGIRVDRLPALKHRVRKEIA